MCLYIYICTLSRSHRHTEFDSLNGEKKINEKILFHLPNTCYKLYFIISTQLTGKKELIGFISPDIVHSVSLSCSSSPPCLVCVCVSSSLCCWRYFLTSSFKIYIAQKIYRTIHPYSRENTTTIVNNKHNHIRTVVQRLLSSRWFAKSLVSKRLSAAGRVTTAGIMPCEDTQIIATPGWTMVCALRWWLQESVLSSTVIRILGKKVWRSATPYL